MRLYLNEKNIVSSMWWSSLSRTSQRHSTKSMLLCGQYSYWIYHKQFIFFKAEGHHAGAREADAPIQRESSEVWHRFRGAHSTGGGSLHGLGQACGKGRLCQCNFGVDNFERNLGQRVHSTKTLHSRRDFNVFIVQEIAMGWLFLCDFTPVRQER